MSGFKDVVGHKNIIKYIQNAVTADAVSHAYILNGERGSGKKLLANLFAMSLQCENRDEDGDACGKCRSCRQAAGGNQPDIIRIMHEKPNTIGVGDIRTQVNDDIMIRPYSSKYKIYIIADADMMSVEAQNALLKTIEEPPEYAVIMLLTENAETLLPTIRSRCVMMKLRNIKDQLVKKYLMEQLEVPDYKADVCVAFAQGNMGKAIMLANSEYFNEIKEEVVHLLRNIDEMTVPDLMEAVKRCMIPFPISALCFFASTSILYFSEILSITSNPTLCLVPSYCFVGFPSPAIINISSTSYTAQIFYNISLPLSRR